MSAGDERTRVALCDTFKLLIYLTSSAVSSPWSGPHPDLGCWTVRNIRRLATRIDRRRPIRRRAALVDPAHDP